MPIECRTRPRKDGTKYTNCYGGSAEEKGEMAKKPKKNKTSDNSKMPPKPKLELEKVLRFNLENKTKKDFDAMPQMYVIVSKGDKYLDARTPKGNPIKVEQRVTYKSKDAPISMLVMPKDGNNLMVKAGKKKGNNFTLALKKLEDGIKAGTMELKMMKAVPTKEWEGSHTMPDGTKMKGTKEAVHGGTPRGRRPKTPPRRKSKVEEAPAGKIAQLAKVRTGTPRRRPSEGVPPGSKRRMLKSGYGI